MASKRLMRKKLALFMAMRAKPYFCEVEYLQGDGNQYIQISGLTLDTNIAIRSFMKPISATNGADVNWFGTGTTASSNDAISGLIRNDITTSGGFCRFLGKLFTYDNHPTPFGKKYDCYYSADSATCDGFNFPSTDTASGSVSLPLTIFKNINSTATGTIQLFSYRIWNLQTGFSLLDLIPVLDWNMRPAMYDKVSRQMFYNQGTGEFAVGRQIHPLEYIESTGRQVILTGITGEARWVGTAQSTARSSRSQIIIGAASLTAKFLASQIGSGGTVWGLSSYAGAYTTVGTTEKATFDVNFTNSLTTATINNQYVSYSASAPFEQEFCVFNRGSNYYFTGKLWELKGYQNNELVRDYIPARDENNVGVLFDKVTHGIFDNSGSGSFICGDDL